MDTFIDYYELLDVDATASSETIKAAFKKLALQYHPDVYKGADAEERMRLLLLAYQTLSNPATRKSYDARRAAYVPGRGHAAGLYSQTTLNGMTGAPASPAGKRHFAFPDLSEPLPTSIVIDLGDTTYRLSPVEASTLRNEGELRGIQEKAGGSSWNYCHRCHHHWRPAVGEGLDPPVNRAGSAQSERKEHAPGVCPSCKASDWNEYLLLRCKHCRAVFESEEIRDNVVGGGRFYYPYELFPLCPHCRRSQWCPAENARVEGLRAAAARRAALLWMSVVVVALVVLGILLVVTIR